MKSGWNSGRNNDDNRSNVNNINKENISNKGLSDRNLSLYKEIIQAEMHIEFDIKIWRFYI